MRLRSYHGTGCIAGKQRLREMNRRQVLIGGGALALAGAGATYFGLRQMGSMEEYSASLAATRAALSKRPEMQDFIRYATLAANGHNTQPWRFRIGEDRIEILPDFARRTYRGPGRPPPVAKSWLRRREFSPCCRGVRPCGRTQILPGE